jgi:hypothetical protein
MAKPKSEQILRKQKEAKQKKLLFVLVPIFLLLMVWQGPGYVKMLTGGGEPAAAPVEDTPPAEETPPADGSTPDPSIAPPPSTTDPSGMPAEAPGAVSLTDSDARPPADEGQLVSFERFVGKDPFRQLVKLDSGGDTSGGGQIIEPVPGGSGGDDGSDGGNGSGSDGGGGGDGGSDDGDEPKAARLDVNGVEQSVSVDEAFPESEQLFKLTKLTRTSAWIGLVTGEFSTGKSSIQVKRGKKLSLVSQPDGIRYTIKLVSVKLG